MRIDFDNWKLCNAVYLSWDDMEVLVNYRLRTILQRDFNVKAFAETDYWEIQVGPMTSQEFIALFNSVNATTEERSKHHASQSIHCSISDSLTLKLIDCELPFAIERVIPNEEGIAMLGKSIPYAKLYSVTEGKA